MNTNSTLTLIDDKTVVVNMNDRPFTVSSDSNPIGLVSQLWPNMQIVWNIPEYDDTLDEFMAKLPLLLK